MSVSSAREQRPVRKRADSLLKVAGIRVVKFPMCSLARLAVPRPPPLMYNYVP